MNILVAVISFAVIVCCVAAALAICLLTEVWKVDQALDTHLFYPWLALWCLSAIVWLFTAALKWAGRD